MENSQTIEGGSVDPKAAQDVVRLEEVARLMSEMGPRALAQVAGMAARGERAAQSVTAAPFVSLSGVVEGLGASLRKIEEQRKKDAAAFDGTQLNKPVNDPIPTGRRADLMAESARILAGQFQALVRPRVVLSPSQMDILRSYLRTAMHVAEDIRENTAR